MLDEKPVQIGQLADDGDGTNKAWTGKKRRRKHLPPSSSDAPATAHDHEGMEDTIQGGQDPISHATDMEGTIQAGQDYDLLLKTEPAQEESEQRFGPQFLLSKEDQAKDCQLLLANIQKEDDYPTDLPLYLTWEEHHKIKARLARYRIAHYKAVRPECAHELKEPQENTDDELHKEVYFQRLEDDEKFEWYIHRADTYNVELNDYQRIVPRNFGAFQGSKLPGRSGNLYRYHDEYRSRYHTYKVDDVYVKYYAEISKKIKWIADFLHLDRKTKDWIEWDTRAWRQALRIATGFPHMTEKLAGYAYDEYITELEMDASLKDIDLLYFEIWRLVAKENIYAVVLEGGIELTHKPLNMAQYAQKKVEIAKQLKLDNEDGFVPFRPFEF
uniref:Uncharacterized protein n=1 Tax=Aegilops tauschii TaxID=37682 RepID=M8BXB5_AEGTA